MWLEIREGRIAISDGATVYEDSPGAFAQDAGAPAPACPAGFNRRYYEPGRRHFLADTTDEAVCADLEPDWPDGDAILAALPDLLAAQAERLVEQLRAEALRAIDAGAEAMRLRFITPGSGQALSYLQKAAEADAYVAAGRPADTGAYLLLEGEAAGRGITVSALADEVRATRDAWAGVAGTIEGVRKAGKDAVTAAVDAAGVDAARAHALAALDAI